MGIYLEKKKFRLVPACFKGDVEVRLPYSVREFGTISRSDLSRFASPSPELLIEDEKWIFEHQV